MARLNLTIPDALYERLEQVRDRINISKICALALERELAMLETKVADEKVAQVLLRLQTARDRWYQRGWDDGVQWATEVATRDDLSSVATKMADWSGERLVQELRPKGSPFIAAAAASMLGTPPLVPVSFHLDKRLADWIARDKELGLKEAGVQTFLPQAGRPEASISVKADEAAYLQGWRDAVKEVWQAVSPSLQ